MPCIKSLRILECACAPSGTLIGNASVLHYLALIVLIFVCLVLSVLIFGRVFLYILNTEENIVAAICAASVAVVCAVLTVFLLLAVTTSIWK